MRGSDLRFLQAVQPLQEAMQAKASQLPPPGVRHMDAGGTTPERKHTMTMNRLERDGKLAKSEKHLADLRQYHAKRQEMFDHGPCDSEHERGILQRKRDDTADDIRREEAHIAWLKEQEVTD